jgi:hypothetical protein
MIPTQRRWFRGPQALSLLIIVGVLFASPLAHAYQKQSLTVENAGDFVVEPGKTEILVDPGQTVVKNVSVTNRIDRRVTFQITTEDIAGTDNPLQAVVLLDDTDGPYSLSDSVQPEITEFSLEFGEKITIPVTISIPANAEPGGHYGAVVISTVPDAAITARQGAQLTSRVGSLFLVRVNGEAKQEGALSGFKVIGPDASFYSKRPEGFEIAFKNTGRVHLVPYGEVTVRNILGIVVDRIPVDAYFALPESTRYREVRWENDRTAFGYYRASVSLYKGYGNDYDEMTVGYFVLPWKTVLLVLAGIIIAVSLINYLRRNFVLKRK